jgi:hypothetical protein
MDSRDSVTLLNRVTIHPLKRLLVHISNSYAGMVLLTTEMDLHLYNTTGKQWHKMAQLSSRQIRLLLADEKCITNTKLLQLSVKTADRLFRKISQLRNVQNKTKLLRLIHGDVYCGARLIRFGLADSDRCIRCFSEETIKHLLYECPYTQEVWGRLGLFPNTASDVINATMSKHEFEIRAELINQLVFRKKILPPEVLVRVVITSFKKGLSKSKGLQDHAASLISHRDITGQWFT